MPAPDGRAGRGLVGGDANAGGRPPWLSLRSRCQALVGGDRAGDARRRVWARIRGRMRLVDTPAIQLWSRQVGANPLNSLSQVV
jgi:hypothetical protein